MKKILFLMMWLFAGCSACEEDAPVQPKLVHDERPVCEQIGVPCSFSEARPEAHTESMALLEDIAKWAANDESIEQIHARLKDNKNLVALSFDEANKLIAYRFEGGLYYTYGEYTREGSKHDYAPMQEIKKGTWLGNTNHSVDGYSKYALILSPFLFEFGIDETLDVATMFRARKEYQHPNGVVLNRQLTLPEYESKAMLKQHLDRYRNWSQKDFILISTHGGVIEHPNKPIKKVVNNYQHTYTSSPSLSAIVLPKGMNCDVLKTVFDDKEVGLNCGLTTVKTSKDKKKHQRSVIKVTTSFLEANNGAPFSNQVLYISACLILSKFSARGGTYLPMENHAVFFGYNKIVNADDAFFDAKSIVTRLLQGYTPLAAFGSPINNRAYTKSLAPLRTRNKEFISRGKGLPSPGKRIVEPVRTFHAQDAQFNANKPVRDAPTLQVVDDAQGAKRLIKGEVEIEGLGATITKQGNSIDVCKPVFGKREEFKWPLYVNMVLLDADSPDAEPLTEEVTIKKDDIKHIGGTSYRVPFEMVLKKVPTKTIDKANLRVLVEYPFDGRDVAGPNFGDYCGGGWVLEDLEVNVDPFELEETLEGTISGALAGRFDASNTTFEPKCIFPGVIDNNYLLKWEAEFENGFGQLEDVYIVLQVNEGVHKPGVQEYGELAENKEATILSVNTSAGFTPSADTHHRSYQNPVRGTVNVVSFPTDLEPGWFAATVSVELTSNDPQAATGTVRMEFDVAHYFDTHPCKQ